jgi:transposase
MIEVKEILYRFQKGYKKRQIARSLNISRNTVDKVIKEAELLGFAVDKPEEELVCIYDKMTDQRQQKSLKSGIAEQLETYRPEIEKWLQEPYMTITQMSRLLKQQANITVSVSSLWRYTTANFATEIRSTMHIVVKPGQQAQVDFGYVGMMLDIVNNKLRKAYAFVMILSYSRNRFVRFVFSQDSETWIDCHIRAFEFFGGVPETVMLDNLKSGVLKADIYDPIINRSYGELERHYNFVADPAKARIARHKGKIERSILIVKQQIIAGIKHDNIVAANNYALNWCLNDIAHKVCSTTGQTPWDLFTKEDKPALKPLPEKQYEHPSWHLVKVQNDQHIVIERSFYSVPCAYVGLEVVARCGRHLLEIFYKEKLIKSHIKAQNKGTWVTDNKDYPKRVQAFLDLDEKACLSEAEAIGEMTFKVCQQILVSPSVTSRRKAQATLRLAKKYSPERLESACKRALDHDNITVKCIKNILESKLDRVKIGLEHVERTATTSGGFTRDPKYFANYLTCEEDHGKKRIN